MRVKVDPDEAVKVAQTSWRMERLQREVVLVRYKKMLTAAQSKYGQSVKHHHGPKKRKARQT